MKRPAARVSETAVAAPVVAWLRALGWRVYQEVQTRGDARADIVATWRDRLVWVVECKTALSWDLLAQAADWRGSAHRISVAVPDRREHRTTGPRSRGMPTFRAVEHEVLEALGLGMFTVGVAGAREVVAPRLHQANRSSVQRWWTRLRPEHEAGFAAAGTAGGGYFTPFRGTVRAIVAEARDRPGMTTRELVAAVDHHYGSDAAAAKNMVRWLGTTALEGSGLVARRDGPTGPWRWFVDPDAEQLGRCAAVLCQMAATARCAVCAERLCPLCVPEHKCRCAGAVPGSYRGACRGRAVRHCACRTPGSMAVVPLCAAHDRCGTCAASA